MLPVVETLECPRRLDTVLIGVPLAMSRVAFVCRRIYRAVEQIVMLNEAILQFYLTNNPPEAARKPL